jgi:hypothetical protein
MEKAISSRPPAKISAAAPRASATECLGVAAVTTSRIMLVMPTRARSVPNTTRRPPKKPQAAVAMSIGSRRSPIRKPSSAAKPAASEASASCQTRWR